MTRGAETKSQMAKRFVGRVSLVLVLFAIVTVSLAARAVHLQVLDTEFLNQQAESRHLRTERISAHRGAITDRNGEPLAISTPVDSIWANPEELARAVDRVPELARILKLDDDLLIRRITRSMDKEFLYLKRHLTPEDAADVLALELPGVNVQREYRRFYPAGEVTGHLLGFTNIDDEGQEGLELAYFFNDTATTEIYTLSLYDALPICCARRSRRRERSGACSASTPRGSSMRWDRT